MAMRYDSSSGSRYTMRVGDAERDEAVAQLREHFTAGRLTIDEFVERLDAALTAKTAGDISRLMADLPRLRWPAQTPTPRSESRDESSVVARYAAVVLLAVLVLLWMTAVTLLFHHGYTSYPSPGGYNH
jgi:Domain of unknown function (DUF1707)